MAVEIPSILETKKASYDVDDEDCEIAPSKLLRTHFTEHKHPK